jgi:hypothetical protein
MKKKIEDLELNRVSISIKTDPQSNRTHTYWQNFEDAEKELYSKV